MQRLKWDASFEIGVAKVDAEHQRLIEVYNELYDAAQAGVTGPDLYNLCFKLCTYTEQHFKHEEQIMRELAYPGYDQHHTHHAYLLTEIATITLRYGEDLTGISARVMDYIWEWLLNHILAEDTLFGKWAKDRE